MVREQFANRRQAGRLLGEVLSETYADRPDVVVLGLPRGGVEVAYEVARILQKPLDVFVVRKLGVPGHEELAMGAIGSGGSRVMNDEVLTYLHIDDAAIERTVDREQAELARRESLFRGDKPMLEVRGKTVLLVDDGLATGSSMRAAIRALHAMEPKALVVAVPVGPPETCSALRAEGQATDVVCLRTPYAFGGVGAWYDDFTQTTTDQVSELLAQAEADPNIPPPT